MAPLTSSIARLMASKESLRASFPVQRVQTGEGGGGGGKSEDEVGESGEGRGEDEEERGTDGMGGAEGGGGGGGGWRGGDNSGLSFGAKPREFPWLSNHSTLQA
jgi:hypothetical protein